MTEESEKNQTILPEKLLIDKTSDFQFHAAYIIYSETYDRSTDLETRKQLNQNITSLQQNLIDCPTFYRNISQYRLERGPQYHYSRSSIKTQRKYTS